MKKSIKSFQLKKQTISNLNDKTDEIKGGFPACLITVVDKTLSVVICGSGGGASKCCTDLDCPWA